jgi:hypothetical protein
LRRDGALVVRFLPLRCRQVLGCGRFCVHCLRGGALPSLHGTERVCCLRRGDLRKQHRLNHMRQLQRGHLLAVNGCLRGLQLHFVRGGPLLCSGRQRVHQLQHRDLRLRHGRFRVRVVWRWLRVCLHRPFQLRCLPVRRRTILCGWYIFSFAFTINIYILESIR